MKYSGQKFLIGMTRRWEGAVSGFREGPIPFMAPAIAASLLELAMLLYSVSMLHLFYMQMTMPIRLPLLSVLSALPAGLTIIMMRSRIAYCLHQASDPILRRRFSRREWRTQNRNGSFTLALATALYFFSIGIMGTNLTLILATPVVFACSLAIVFALMPAPRNMDECLEYAEYGQKTPLSRLAPGLVAQLGNDPFRLANRS